MKYSNRLKARFNPTRRKACAMLVALAILAGDTDAAQAFLLTGGIAAGAGTLTIPMTLYNVNTSTSAVAPNVSYGHPFGDGDIPAGGSVTATDSNGNPVTVQMDGVSTWPSGCVKFAVLSHAMAETIAASGNKVYTLKPSATAPNNTPNSGTWGGSTPQLWANTLAANSDIKVIYTGLDLGVNTYTVSFNTIIGATGVRNPGWGTSYPTSGWEVTKQGPVCVEFHAWQYIQNDSTGKYHGYVRCDMWVKAWSPTGPYEIDVRTSEPNIWNTITQSSTTSENYNVAQGRVACNITVQNGATVLRYQGTTNDPASFTVANAKFNTTNYTLTYPAASPIPGAQTGYVFTSSGTLPTGLVAGAIYWPAYVPALDACVLCTQRQFVSFFEQNFGLPAAWTANTAYVVGSWVTNNNIVYYCTTAGTSAASGGPTGGGINSNITDGTCHWTNQTVAFTSQGTGTITASPVSAVFPSAAFHTADLLGDAIWSGAGSKPQISPGHDFTYLTTKSKFIPAFYPVGTTAPNTAITNFYPNQLIYGLQWYQSATGGGLNRICYVNNIGVCAISRPQDGLYYWQTLQGSHSWANSLYNLMYDESGGERMIPNNGTNNSGATYMGLPSNMGNWVSTNKCGSVDSGIVARSATGWSHWSGTLQDASGLGGQYYADPSHSPQPSLIAYLKTGRPIFMEQSVNQAHSYTMMVYNGYQTANSNVRYALCNGSVQSTQLRGWAWAWRTLTRAMFMIPDNHPYYTVLRDIYNDNLGYEADRINTVYPTQQVSVGIPAVLDHGGFDTQGHYAPWMLFFFITTVSMEKWGGGQTSAGQTAIATISNFLGNYWKIIQTSVDPLAVNTVSAYDLLYSTLNYSYSTNMITNPTTMWNASVANGLIDAYPRAILYDHDAPGQNFPVTGWGFEAYAPFAQFASYMHSLAEPANGLVTAAQSLIANAIAGRTGQPLSQGGLQTTAATGSSGGVVYNNLAYTFFKGS